MARTYNAFLVRHWSLDTERGNRIEVVHVQSGDRSLVASMTQAASWMQTWADSEGHDDSPRATVSSGEAVVCHERPSLPPIIV